MPQIAIIDDNIDLSGTLKKTLDHYLRKFGSNFTVVTQQPFHNVKEYFSFVTSNDICVLILDERLNDKPTFDGSPVDYLGNELVSSLRTTLKDFPIVMITTFSDEEDVINKESEFEYMLNRDEITVDENMANLYVPRIIRSGQRYLDSNNKELSEYNGLTRAIATGKYSTNDIARLEALQIKLELPVVGFDDRQVWLNQYELHINEMEDLKRELEKKLNL